MLMGSCIDSYHASTLMENLLERLLLDGTDNDVKDTLKDLSLMGASEIVPCMECAPCYDFIFYSQTMQKFFSGVLTKKSLNDELHIWKKTQLRDEALTKIRGENSQYDFNKKPFKTSGTKIYLDQNILSLYAQDEKIKSALNNFCDRGTFCFFYSPSNLEEINKIPNDETKSQIIEALTAITKNVVVLPDGNVNSFFVEPPYYGLKRIEKYEGSTEALEELKLISSNDRKMYLEKYDSAEHKQKIANNQNILESLTVEEFRKLISLSHSSLYDKEQFKNIESRTEALHAIYTLSNIFDLLGYKVDKKEKTKKSSLHDIEHLIYGLDTDLFVTNDRKLQSRALQIYKFMGVKVKVVTLDELLLLD